MENVVCSCSKCKAALGCFRNAWNGIGNTYFSPVYPPASALDGLVAMNSIYKGTEQTQIENSYLQDVACKGCGVVLGLRCDSAPQGHLLKRNQLILRLAEMTVTSERTGQKTAVSIIERFPLTLPGAAKPQKVGRASTVQPTNRAGTPGLINRSAGSVVLPQLMDDSQVRELEKFKDWARSSIKSQQNDIDRIGGAVDRMERDLESFKVFMQETRTELAAHRQFQERLQNEELSVLKEDFDVIRLELDANRQFQNSLKGEEFPVLQEDINALRSELAKAQRFQQELKSNDIRNVRQSIDGMRQNIVDITHSMNNNPKVSHNEIETLTGEVRKINQKVTEIDSLTKELGYFRSQLSSIETLVQETIASRESGGPSWNRVSDQMTGGMSGKERSAPGAETYQLPTPYEREREHTSLSKRRHLEAQNNDEEPFGPPAKRLMRSTGQRSAMRPSGNNTSDPFIIQAQTQAPSSPPSPIIISSNHGSPSPILDRYDAQNVQNIHGKLNHSNNASVQFDDHVYDIPDEPEITYKPRVINRESLRQLQPVGRSIPPPVLDSHAAKQTEDGAGRTRGAPTPTISAAKGPQRRAVNPKVNAAAVSSESQSLTGTPNGLLKSAIGNSIQHNAGASLLDKKGRRSNGSLFRSSGKFDGQSSSSLHKTANTNSASGDSVVNSTPQSQVVTALNPGEKPGQRSQKAEKKAADKENLNQRYARQRSDTPDQLSTLSADESMHKSVQRRVSGGTAFKDRNIPSSAVGAPIDSDSPIPSIEDNPEAAAPNFSVVIPTLPSPPPAIRVDADSERPFICTACGKRYKFIGTFERHKVISIRCKGGEVNQNTKVEEMRKRKLRERERLATELLEHE